MAVKTIPTVKLVPIQGSSYSSESEVRQAWNRNEAFRIKDSDHPCNGHFFKKGKAFGSKADYIIEYGDGQVCVIQMR